MIINNIKNKNIAGYEKFNTIQQVQEEQNGKSLQELQVEQICIVPKDADELTENDYAVGYAIKKNLVGYLIKEIKLAKNTYYRISCTISYPEKLVFLSGIKKENANEVLTEELLFNNIIDLCYSTSPKETLEEGMEQDIGCIFSKAINGSDYAKFYLWTNIAASDLLSGGELIYDLDSSVRPVYVENLIQYSFNSPKEESNYETPKFVISGEAKEISEVIISSPLGKYDYNSLSNTIVLQTPVVDNAFSLEYKGEHETEYVLWGIGTKKSSLKITSYKIQDGGPVCLSGDTLITLFDYSTKRMDEVKVGDILLGQDGLPTKVKSISRGNFNKYHTLYYFEKDIIIDETFSHRFFNIEQGFWQKLELWNIGEHAIMFDKTPVQLLRKERIEEKVEMFGIYTESGTYYANGLLSGAAFCNKELLEEAEIETMISMLSSINKEDFLKLVKWESELP